MRHIGKSVLNSHMLVQKRNISRRWLSSACRPPDSTSSFLYNTYLCAVVIQSMTSFSLTDFKAEPRISADPGTAPGLWVQNVIQFIHPAAGYELGLFLPLLQNPLMCHHNDCADVGTADRVSHRGDVNTHYSSLHRHSAVLCAFLFN